MTTDEKEIRAAIDAYNEAKVSPYVFIVPEGMHYHWAQWLQKNTPAPHYFKRDNFFTHSLDGAARVGSGFTRLERIKHEE